MLLRFQVANHRSILKPAELSMIAVDEDRAATRGFDLLNERVLTVAGIYGPNASGKSNVISAITWLSQAVGTSLRAWEQVIPRDPFRFGRGPDAPSEFEAELIVGGVRYAYRLELDDSQDLFEGLYSYPERRRRVLFEREGQEIHFRRGLGTLAGTRELLTPATLALSAAMRFNDPEVQPFGRHLAGMRVFGTRRVAFAGRVRSPSLGLGITERLFYTAGSPPGQATLFDDSELGLPDQREAALALLRFADLGIDDVKVIESPDIGASGQPRRELVLIHRAGGEELPFNLPDESAGTLTWLALIGPALAALRSGEIMLFDEIDASLHPKLSARLLELFQDPVTNPRGAPLSFTTNDTSLLGRLNRDEVWLTEKGEDGATSLTALAEFGGDKVRRSLNLEKAYLQGRFGAVPELDQVTVRRVLGDLPPASWRTGLPDGQQPGR